MAKIHICWSIAELVLLGIFCVCIFYNYTKTWNFWTRVALSVGIIVINIVQMVIEIKFEKNFALSAWMIFIWIMNLCTYYPQYKRRKNFRKTFRK